MANSIGFTIIVHKAIDMIAFKYPDAECVGITTLSDRLAQVFFERKSVLLGIFTSTSTNSWVVEYVGVERQGGRVTYNGLIDGKIPVCVVSEDD